MATRTPPHLAEPKLTYASADDDAYITAVVRGFHGDFSAEHWEQEKPVVEWDRLFGFRVEDRWIATCGAYSRTLTVPGGEVPTAAVTIVTVAPAYRRRGLLTQMMRHQLEQVRSRGTEPVALLWASESLIYGRYGYGHATPRTAIKGQTRSMAFLPSVELGPGSVDEVSRDEFATAGPQLRQRVVGERPGYLNRTEAWWNLQLYDPEAWRQGASSKRYALHFDAAGDVDGYAIFRLKNMPESEFPSMDVQVLELEAAAPGAYAALWRFLLDLDLVRSFRRGNAPFDEPLRHLVLDHRAIATEVLDGTYARILDVRAALEARRYAAPVDLVLEVHDQLLPDLQGCYRLQGDLDGASVSRTRQSPDVSLAVRELGAGYLGGVPLNALHRAGLVHEHTTGAVNRLSSALAWPVLPFCPDHF